MTAKTLNIQLLDLYQTYTQSIYSQTWEDNVSAPLLMHVFDEYCVMENKILFVGQETFGWHSMSAKPSVTELLLMYKGFQLGKPSELREGKRQRILSSPFWNFCRSTFHELNRHLCGKPFCPTDIYINFPPATVLCHHALSKPSIQEHYWAPAGIKCRIGTGTF